MRYVGKPHNQDGSKCDIVESLILITYHEYLVSTYMGTISENKNGSLQNISLYNFHITVFKRRLLLYLGVFSENLSS